MTLPVELLERGARPFVWGSADCANWAAASVEYFSGRQFTLPVYSSKRQADRIVGQHGSIGQMVEACLGRPVPVADAELGDVVLSSFPATGELLGVADPPIFWVRTAGGLFPVELELASMVWACRQ